MRITSRTSMKGIRLISGSSFQWPRKFIRALRSAPLAMDHVDDPRGLLLHLDHEGFDLAAEVAEEDRRGHGNQDAKPRVVERDRDAMRELRRVRSGRSLRSEDLDHTHDR